MSDFHHYRSKPVQVQAMQWMGGQDGANDIMRWVMAHGGVAAFVRTDMSSLPYLQVETYHSTTAAIETDYVVKDAWDQFDVIDEITFKARYEEVQR